MVGSAQLDNAASCAYPGNVGTTLTSAKGDNPHARTKPVVRDCSGADSDNGTHTGRWLDRHSAAMPGVCLPAGLGRARGAT